MSNYNYKQMVVAVILAASLVIAGTAQHALAATLNVTVSPGVTKIVKGGKGTLSLTVKDSANKAVSGASITFTVKYLKDNVVFKERVYTATTDSTGKAVITVFIGHYALGKLSPGKEGSATVSVVATKGTNSGTGAAVIKHV